MKEEIFGPVLPIVSFENFEEVLDEANNSDYGLSSYTFYRKSKRSDVSK
ncbi:aldehyde dehydrogenase family protein [Staphylococcus pseudoxylosus]